MTSNVSGNLGCAYFGGSLPTHTVASALKQKVVLKVGLFRFGMRKFQNEVNCALTHGWKLEHMEVRKGLFRYFCEAVLFKFEFSEAPQESVKCCKQ